MYKKLPKIDSNTIALIDYRDGVFKDYVGNLSWSQNRTPSVVLDDDFKKVLQCTGNYGVEANYDLGSNFTIEFWVQSSSSSISPDAVIFSDKLNGQWRILTHRWFQFVYLNDVRLNAYVDFPVNRWVHIAFSVLNNYGKLFFNGTSVANGSISSSNYIYLFSFLNKGSFLPSEVKIGAVRISNIARWTSNFNPNNVYLSYAESLITSNEPLNLLNKSKVKGFTINGIQPANTNRKVAFKVDNKWNKLTTEGALSPLPTQAITSDSVLAEGNTVAELTALTNVPSLVGKLVYPAIALYASEEAEVMPTFGMTVKAEIDTTVNVYSYTTYSQEYTISEGDDVPIVSIVAETELKGNGNVAITARIKQNNEWTEYMNLNDAQMKKASAIQLKAVYTVQSTTGNDSAEIKGVIIKYNTSGAITSNSTTDIVTVMERFTNDLTYVHAYVKHKELVDAQIKVCCSLRKTPSKRIMYQFGNGTGALKTFTLPDSGINQDTLLVYVDGKLVYDFGYNTETSEITISADKDTALSVSYEYGWEKSEWIEMEQGVSQINDSGAYTTEYSYTIPEHEGEYTVTAIKYELIRPEGKVTNDVIGVGTGKRQIIQLPHYARKETIQCNGKWSYDYDSKRLTVIAPADTDIVISYNWIAESPQVYAVMAGWAD